MVVNVPHPLTLTTFLFPLLPPGTPAAAAAAFSCACALIPAFTVSNSIPDATAGEYGDTREVNAGSGSGGTDGRFPGALLVAGFEGAGALGFVEVLCFAFPLIALVDAGGFCASRGSGAVKGGLGTLSGFVRCIWKETISSNCFSVMLH